MPIIQQVKENWGLIMSNYTLFTIITIGAFALGRLVSNHRNHVMRTEAKRVLPLVKKWDLIKAHGKWISGKDLIHRYKVSSVRISEALKTNEIHIYDSESQNATNPKPMNILDCWHEQASREIEKANPSMDITDLIEESYFISKGVVGVLL